MNANRKIYLVIIYFKMGMWTRTNRNQGAQMLLLIKIKVEVTRKLDFHTLLDVDGEVILLLVIMLLTDSAQN